MSLLSTAKAGFGGFSVVVVLLFFLFVKVLFPFLLYFGRKRMRDVHIFHARIYIGVQGGSRPPAKFKFL